MATTAFSPASTPSIGDDGHVVDDLACIKCTYNLRGCQAEGRCPECGLAVGRSAVGHWLRYCDPDWLRRVWRGLNLIAVLIVGLCLAYWLEFIGFIDNASNAWPDWFTAFVPVTIVSIGIVLGVMGLWQSTTPDPAKLNDERFFCARRLARWLLIGSIVMVVAQLGLWAHVRWRINRDVFATTVSLSLLLGIVLILSHARSLAIRIPKPMLARMTWAAMVVIGATGFTLAAMHFDWFQWHNRLSQLLSSPEIDREITRQYNLARFYVWHTFLWIIIGGILVTAILLLAYWRALHREADIARQTWARAAAG